MSERGLTPAGLDPESLVDARQGRRWCLFVDRDGVLNRRIVGDYVRSRDQFEPLPGALDALAHLTRWAPHVVVVTNQRGIATGAMSQAAVDDVHAYLAESLAERSSRVDAVLVCPHATEPTCSCRKPEPGAMLGWLASHPDVDPALSIMIGDQGSDVEAGRRLARSVGGCTTIAIGVDDHGADLRYSSLPDFHDALAPFLERSPR